MSEPTKTPLTMTAEREQQIRNRDIQSFRVEDLLREIDATRVKLDQVTGERSAAARIITDGQNYHNALKAALDKAREELAAKKIAMAIPGTYVRCLSGHLFPITRGDEECPTCELKQERDKLREANSVLALDKERLDGILKEGCYLGHMSRRFKDRAEIDIRLARAEALPDPPEDK